VYVAVKGGEKAIAAAHELLAKQRRGDPAVPEITAEQIAEQLTIAVDRVMTEGSLYDRELAATAIKQARGDVIEAIFLVRAFRTTLPRFGFSQPIATSAMRVRRRISATFKDLPGGQILGPTFDYTHRLIDPDLATPSTPSADSARSQQDHAGLDTHQSGDASAISANDDCESALKDEHDGAFVPRVSDLIGGQGLIEPNPAIAQSEGPPADITRDTVNFPMSREARLQALARGDEGYLLALGYSTQRGFGRTHPFAGEIRMGDVEVEFTPPELGFAVPLGRITLTECEMVNQFTGSKDKPPQFTRGYGLAFGHSERKAMAMALVDRSLRAGEFGETTGTPAQDEEFVIAHSDNVQATGFVEHLKLPHYVDFQAELGLLRQLRKDHEAHGSRETAALEGSPEPDNLK